MSKVGKMTLSIFALLSIVIVTLSVYLFTKPKAIQYEWYIESLNLQGILEDIDTSTITIAILDTGISEKLQETYKDRIIHPFNVTTQDKDVTDLKGHGTRVASVLMGTVPEIGIYGISQKSKIMPVVIVNSSGTIEPKHLAEAIYYAVNHGANVINISMGSRIEHRVVTEAI